jgi:branched-chain amino acid transport system permease protein
MTAVRQLAADLLAGRKFAFAVPLLAAVVVFLFPMYSTNQYWIREIALIAILALVVSGVNLSFGYAGELQFGQVFMYALGAYLTAILAEHGLTEIIPLLIIGGLVAMIAGAVVALPAVRMGGWSLAMASFFLVIMIPDLVGIWQRWTGGLSGLVGLPFVKLGGAQLGLDGLFYVTVGVTILWLACYRNLVTSRYGIIFRVLRESPVLTGSIGFSLRRLKVFAYSAGSLPAGLAGCMSGFVAEVLTPDTYGLSLAIGIIAASILGGTESVYGAVLGATLLQLGPEDSLSFQQYSPIVYGVFLIVAAVLLRRGIGGLALLGAGKASRLIMPTHERPGIDPRVAPAAVAQSEHSAARIGALQGHALRVDDISKSFGGNRALSGVSLVAEPGVVTALVGSNGSGKTTLLNVICGYQKATTGHVEISGRRISTLPPHRIARLGVGRTFQTPSVPRGVTAADVVASGRFSLDHCGILASVLRLPRYWRTRREDRRRARELLELVGLAHLADAECASLSLGTRRLVEVARALAGNPGLLLLDEPASGLSDEEVILLGHVVRSAAEAGATVMLIEHNFGFVKAVSDVLHVLHVGKLLASGTVAEVAARADVVESFLGVIKEPAATPPAAAAAATALAMRDPEAAPAAMAPEAVTPPGPPAPILEVRGLDTGYGDLQVIRGLSLTMPRGTIELVLGRNGVGKTTLVSAIAGALRCWTGEIILDGTDISGRSANRRAADGIALVQEGKRIFRHRTVLENVVLGTYTLSMGRRERHEFCQSILEHFPVLAERAGQHAGLLSGGQQQMLAIAQALAARPRLLLLDEPSAGLAPAIVGEVFARVRQLREDGMSVLLVEQLAEQALEVADHVTIIDAGRVVASGPPSRFHDLNELREAYFGEAPKLEPPAVDAGQPAAPR